MANSKSGKSRNKSKKADSGKMTDGSAEIRRAEKRLAKALAGVDEAREKVLRRERDLAKLMKRHGHAMPVSIVESDAIPLEAPSQHASANGISNDGGEPADAESVEQTASTHGDLYHA